jgi:hypothetical protein
MGGRQTTAGQWLRALDALLTAALAACVLGIMFVLSAFIIGLTTGA